MADTYRIVRFFQSGRQRVMDTGLTLEEAREHCSDPSTEGKSSAGDWFDGFVRE